MNTALLTSHKPSVAARVAAPVARVWQGVQNKVANLVGLKNSGFAAGVVTVAGLTTMAVATILGPLAPAVYGAGTTIATAGAVGIGENIVTNKVSRMDGKGKV